MSDYYVDYGQGIKILFHDVVTRSGIDTAMKYGMNIFPPEELLLFGPPFIRPNDIVYDIGSYVGTHAFLFSLWGAKVYAFEPSPFNYPRLVKNINWFNSHYNNPIECFDIAFNEKEYDVVTPFKDCNTVSPLDLDAEQLIKYRILDKFIADNNLPIPDFIKIDIEGMETILFKTLHNILSNNKTIVYVERHRKSKDNRNVQHYEHNPNWRFPDEGGYDFNDLKKYNVEAYNFKNDSLFRKLGPDSDFNEIDESLVLFPPSRIEQLRDKIKTI